MDPRLIEEAHAAVRKHGTVTLAAKALGIPRKTLCNRYHAQPKDDQAAPAATPRESLDIKERHDDCDLIYIGEKIKTAEQLVESAGIDLAIWEIAEQTVNNWEVAGKRSMGQDEQGRWKPESLWATGLRQIKVKLRRKAPKPIQDAIRELMGDVKPCRFPKPKRSRCRDPHMLEVGIFDHHFGKLCWGEETGTPYDLKIAEREFVAAIDEMLDRVKHFQIEKVIFPLGNDFFHANDWFSQTANGTRIESSDDRFSKVFQVGERSAQYAVERCREVADVEIIWVPGNHDRHTSWYLVQVLAAIFRNDEHVSIDNGPRLRKYISYGPSLLGYTHGDEEKDRDLPTLMAVEAAEAWAKATFRAWRVGHLHTKKETRFNAGDTHFGVEVRRFPSMCGTDSWHHMKGYVRNARMAECHLWSKETGPVGYFTVHAKTPLAA